MEVENYTIFLDFSKSSDRFSGSVEINLNGKSDSIRLDSHRLQINEVKINGRVADFSVNPDDQSLLIKSGISGKSEISILYEGNVSQSLSGLYKVSNEDGVFLTTQFEPTGARTVFPCFDNPSVKAKFSLSVRTPPDMRAISNMPVKQQRKSPDNVVFDFDDTPRMSTYLVYVGVGKFSEKTREFGGTKISLLVPGNELKSNDFPIETAAKVKEFFEGYFGVKYMLPHMQLISVPEFAAGAMENWGAITFRESAILTTAGTSHRARKTVAESIAHEIAHQWFGDLTTMKWWNDLWLNESFATFMAFKAVDAIYPEFNVWDDFILTYTSWGFHGDSLMNSHPIDVKVTNPDEIAQIFDEISYGKGASVIRMIESYIGEEIFMKGVRSYLAEFAYSNATGEDLWKHLDRASGLPVSEVMNDWIKKAGYPVIDVSMSGNRMTIRQRQFFLKGGKSDQSWLIPLTFERDGKTESVLMDRRELSLDSSGITRLNPDRAGFYRINYGDGFPDGTFPESGRVSDIDRWGIASDLFAMVENGSITVKDYLSRVSRLFSQKSFIVGQEIAVDLFSILLLGRKNELLKEYIRKFCTEQLSILGHCKKEGEDQNLNSHRDSLFQKLSLIDMSFAKEHGSKFLDFPSIDPDLRNSVSTAFALSTDDFGRMHETMMSCDSDEARVIVLGTMGWLSGKENFDRILQMAESGDVKKQDVFRVLITASVNSYMAPYAEKSFEDFIRLAREIFEGSGYESSIAESLISYLGLYDPDSFAERVERITGPDILQGVQKGLETLDVHRRLYSQLSG